MTPDKEIDTNDVKQYEVLTIVNVLMKRYLQALELMQMGRGYFQHTAIEAPLHDRQGNLLSTLCIYPVRILAFFFCIFL